MHRFSFLPMTLVLTACGLTACSGGGDSSAISLDQKSGGLYTVGLGSADAPDVGQYLAAANGERLLVVNDSHGMAAKLYRQAAGGAWTSVPAATVNETVSLLSSQTELSAAVSLAALAGTYITQIETGVSAQFVVAADGTISTGSDTCKLFGKLSQSQLPAAAQLTLNTSNCANLPATLAGVLLVDKEYAPVSFRLVVDNGSKVFDLWAFKS